MVITPELFGSEYKVVKLESNQTWNCSLNDDLEDLLESLRSDEFETKISLDSKNIFLSCLLTDKDIKKLKSKNEEFKRSFFNSMDFKTLYSMQPKMLANVF